MDTILICPYCMDEKTGDELGCCGESCDHFIEISLEDYLSGIE